MEFFLPKQWSKVASAGLEVVQMKNPKKKLFRAKHLHHRWWGLERDYKTFRPENSNWIRISWAFFAHKPRERLSRIQLLRIPHKQLLPCLTKVLRDEKHFLIRRGDEQKKLFLRARNKEKLFNAINCCSLATIVGLWARSELEVSAISLSSSLDPQMEPFWALWECNRASKKAQLTCYV